MLAEKFRIKMFNQTREHDGNSCGCALGVKKRSRPLTELQANRIGIIY